MRVALLAGAICGVLLPVAAAAQLPGMPVWDSPRAGTGLLVAADVGRPDSSGGNGSTFAGRVALGFSALTLSASVGTRDPDGGPNTTVAGGTVAYRVIGGSLIPIAVNVQGGIAGVRGAGRTERRYTGALGFSVDLPLPGITFEPWVAPGLRTNYAGATGSLGSTTNTNFGIAGGITLGFGLIGVHAALDYEHLPGGGHTTTLGLGVDLDIRPSVGL
ncbi:MAG TPA: hypothetical protein VN848_11080 [Gemmatimonadales bacterium]|nr:hypothetical protein [Gemmatimonadales bacterium]